MTDRECVFGKRYSGADSQPAPQPEPLLFPGFRRAIFISNGTDFQVETPGTLYFYRNYFGERPRGPGERQGFFSQLDGAHTEKELKNLVKYKPPKVECRHSSTKVVTNPRWL